MTNNPLAEEVWRTAIFVLVTIIIAAIIHTHLMPDSIEDLLLKGLIGGGIWRLYKLFTQAQQGDVS